MSTIAETLTISIVQNDLVWEDKKANLESFEKMIGEDTGKKEIVLLPEMYSTGFSMNPEAFAETMEGETVKWMKRVSAQYKIILAGSAIISEDGHFYNRLIWMLPTGEYGYYDKRHLFGYAGEDDNYTSGKKRLIASVKGWKINLLVCYDLRFPVWSRQSVSLVSLPDGTFEKNDNNSEPEYDVLVYVANWPERRIHAWKTLLQARAIENQCYVAGVNRVGDDGNDIHYSGESMIVDPMGKPVLSAGDKKGVYTYSITMDDLKQVRSKLPFLKDADPFIIGS